MVIKRLLPDILEVVVQDFFELVLQYLQSWLGSCPRVLSSVCIPIINYKLSRRILIDFIPSILFNQYPCIKRKGALLHGNGENVFVENSNTETDANLSMKRPVHCLSRANFQFVLPQKICWQGRTNLGHEDKAMKLAPTFSIKLRCFSPNCKLHFYRSPSQVHFAPERAHGLGWSPIAPCGAVTHRLGRLWAVLRSYLTFCCLAKIHQPKWSSQKRWVVMSLLSI